MVKTRRFETRLDKKLSEQQSEIFCSRLAKAVRSMCSPRIAESATSGGSLSRAQVTPGVFNLFILLQHCLPQILLTRLAGLVARCRWRWLKNILITSFVRHYQVNMQEALQPDARQYASFHDFFIRELRPDARPIDLSAQAIISPVDGVISEVGMIQQGQIIQAKQHHYSVQDLLASDAELAQQLQRGLFMTAYLSPKDYHRIHMPLSGQLRKMVYVPGKLFSVNPQSVAAIDNLFARNERVICEFDTEAGKMVLVLVGAMIVGSMQTAWHGVVNASRTGQVTVWHYDEQNIHLNKGEPLGFFSLGSTVIILLPAEVASWEAGLVAGSALRMGQGIAKLTLANLAHAKARPVAIAK